MWPWRGRLLFSVAHKVVTGLQCTSCLSLLPTCTDLSLEPHHMRALRRFIQALETCASCKRQPGIQLAALHAVGSQIRSVCAGKEPDQAAAGWAGDCFAAVAPAAVVCARKTAQDPSVASLDAQRTQVRAILPTACARVQYPTALPLLRPLRLRALRRMRRFLRSLQQILEGRRSEPDMPMHMRGCTVPHYPGCMGFSATACSAGFLAWGLMGIGDPVMASLIT